MDGQPLLGSGEVRSNDPLTTTLVGANTREGEHLDYGTIPRKVPVGDLASRDITYFMKKRVRVTNGVFSSTDTNNWSTWPLNVSLWSFISTSSFYANKFEGFQGMKIGGKVTVQINATPFTYGRYLLSTLNTYGYQRNSSGGGPPSLALYKNGASISARTTLPNVEINLNEDTLVSVPFCMHLPQEYFLSTSTATEIPDPVIVQLSVIQSFQTGATSSITTCPWDMYIELDSIEPIGSGFVQSNVSTMEGKSTGPLSGALKKVAATTKILGKAPMLSSFMQPAGYISSLLADAASVWGWSVPTNINASEKMAISRLDGVGHVDARRNTLPLSVIRETAVAPATVNGILEDQMSFNHVLERYAWIWNQSWTTANNSGTLLWSQYVAPSFATYQDTVAGKVVYSGPPVFYFSNLFKYWRGSMRYKFKLNKTQFHAGRLLVILTPPNSGFNDNAPVTLGTVQQFYHKVIWDVRAQTELEITVPHLNLNDWNSCNNPLSQDNNGTLSIYVLDALVAPDTVPLYVSVSVYVSAGEDFKFSVLQPNNAATRMGPVVGVLQSGTSALMELGQANKDEGELASTLCTGERFTSFRQIVKVPMLWGNDSNVGPSDSVKRYYPFQLRFSQYNTNTGTYNIVRDTDFIDYVGLCYGAMRGSVRLNWLTTLPSGQAITWLSGYHGSQNNPYLGSATAWNAASFLNAVTHSVSLESGVDITVPAFCRTPYYATLMVCNPGGSVFGHGSNVLLEGNSTSFRASTAPCYYVNVRWFVQQPTSGPDPLNVNNVASAFRSAGDDFDLQGFLSAPWLTSVV